MVIRRLVWTGAQMEPHILASYLLLRVDVVIVANLLGVRAVGLYSVAVVFAEAVWVLSNAITLAAAERQAAEDEREALDVTARVARMSVFVTVAASLAIGVLARPAITLVYGEPYEAAMAAVWPVLAASVAMALWRAVSPAVVRAASPAFVSAVSVGALTLNVVGNLVLVRPLGIAGAGLASALSYAAGAGAAMEWLRRRRGLRYRDVVPSIEEPRAVVDVVRRTIVRLAGAR